MSTKKTYDATSKLAFRITAGDIKRAKRKDPTSCAAAIALKRQLGADKVEVHVARTYVEIGGRRRRFATPPALKTEIVAIDRGGRFAPGEYTLKAIQPSHTQAATKAARRKRKREGYTPEHRRRATPNVRPRAR